MLSLYPSSSAPLTNIYQPKISSQDVPDSLRTSIETFTRAIHRSRVSGTKLLCTIPTWGSDDSGWDLADLQEQRSRLLVLIHDLIKTLKNFGIEAKYSLVPSDSARCIVCALPPDVYLNQVVISEIEKIRPYKSGVSFVEASVGPCLVFN